MVDVKDSTTKIHPQGSIHPPAPGLQPLNLIRFCLSRQATYKNATIEYHKKLAVVTLDDLFFCALKLYQGNGKEEKSQE